MITFDQSMSHGGLLCGIDEAGRGPLFGPVVVASVVLPLDEAHIIQGINDSKKLTAKKREQLYEQIIKNAIEYHIAFVDVDTIDKINILQATILGMKECVQSLKTHVENILVDGNPVDLGVPAQNIVHGDATSYHIAAASILAKVARDRYIEQIADQFPQFDLVKHKGYGTAKHRQELKMYGPTAMHRKSFLTHLDRW